MRTDPYFNRSAERFCSHRHTPYDREKTCAAAVLTERVAYIGWNIFREYAEEGAAHLRSMVLDAVDRLLGADKTMTTTLPSCGVTTLMRQPVGNGERMVHHLVYGVPKCRGKVEMIEDLPIVANTVCTVKTGRMPARVYLAPSGEEIPFAYEEGTVTYTVPAFECSVMVVVEF
jgi:hypothetical protein